ncbi:small-conductance mechanosensitive channel [Chitinivorax tropicus]|uniref:Small-conductance mechanosensitive channel n=1 Tax=Chitinivorax tropicus TaxID=714531 RepID=A0A840MML2_9PROT|nr:mechanosensitive ion channel domain-containing protein [Chitinivorax tropicus]MBB5018359.1 small-conductance mechanosensitive channel [Chitinivorax tropicus]
MTVEREIHNLIMEAAKDVGHIDLLWQSGVLALSLLLAWLVTRLMRGTVNAESANWEAGVGSFKRAFFPLSALLFIWIGKTLLSGFYSVRLLKVVIPLLATWAAIRVAVYMLRYIFPNRNWLKRFERWIAVLVWCSVALHMVGWLPDVMDMLDDLSFTFGKHRISALIVLSSLLWFSVTMLAAMWLGSFIEQRIMKADDLNMNMRVVMTKVARALLMVLGVLVALPMIGIDITMLSVFGGAFGVGLGLGLQKIASNYVSGFVILLDRSIRPGDFVIIDNRVGNITRLTARYVVVRSLDGSEAIIPNETLITSTVVNRSYTDKNLLIELPIQVAYQSDLDQVREIMLEAVQSEPRVLVAPEPSVALESFGESGINMKATFWIRDPENGQLGLKSAINFKIWHAFKAAGIEIPYTRREVTILNKPTMDIPGA